MLYKIQLLIFTEHFPVCLKNSIVSCFDDAIKQFICILLISFGRTHTLTHHQWKSVNDFNAIIRHYTCLFRNFRHFLFKYQGGCSNGIWCDFLFVRICVCPTLNMILCSSINTKTLFVTAFTVFLLFSKILYENSTKYSSSGIIFFSSSYCLIHPLFLMFLHHLLRWIFKGFLSILLYSTWTH